MLPAPCVPAVDPCLLFGWPRSDALERSASRISSPVWAVHPARRSDSSSSLGSGCSRPGAVDDPGFVCRLYSHAQRSPAAGRRTLRHRSGRRTGMPTDSQTTPVRCPPRRLSVLERPLRLPGSVRVRGGLNSEPVRVHRPSCAAIRAESSADGVVVLGVVHLERPVAR